MNQWCSIILIITSPPSDSHSPSPGGISSDLKEEKWSATITNFIDIFFFDYLTESTAIISPHFFQQSVIISPGTMLSTREENTPKGPPHTRHHSHQRSSQDDLEDESLDILVMNIDECEWVDDAVLSITSAFGFCHTRDYADRQIEYEHALQKCQRGREMANESNNDVSTRYPYTGRSLLSASSESDDDQAQLLRINSQFSLMDDVFLDNTGMEVQLQAIYLGGRKVFRGPWINVILFTSISVFFPATTDVNL